MHAHTPHCRAAPYLRRLPDRRVRAGGGGGRHAGRVAIRPHAHARRAVRARPAPHGLHRLGGGRRRPRRALAGRLCRRRPCGALPRARRLPLQGHPAGRRRGRRPLRRARPPRARRGVHRGLVRPRPAALRPAAREPLLGLDRVLRRRGGAVRGGAGAAHRHGVLQRRRRRRPGAVPRARRHGRRLSRAGDRAGAHRVLRRRDRPDPPHGGLHRADHRRRRIGRDLPRPRARADRRRRPPHLRRALRPRAERHRARRHARDGEGAHRHARARPLHAAHVRIDGQPARPREPRHPRGAFRAPQPVRRLRPRLRGPGAPCGRGEGVPPRRPLRASPAARLRPAAAPELRVHHPRGRRGDRRAEDRAALARGLRQPVHLARAGGGEQPLRLRLRHPGPRRARVHGAVVHRRVHPLRGVAAGGAGERGRRGGGRARGGRPAQARHRPPERARPRGGRRDRRPRSPAAA